MQERVSVLRCRYNSFLVKSYLLKPVLSSFFFEGQQNKKKLFLPQKPKANEKLHIPEPFTCASHGIPILKKSTSLSSMTLADNIGQCILFWITLICPMQDWLSIWRWGFYDTEFLKTSNGRITDELEKTNKDVILDKSMHNPGVWPGLRKYMNTWVSIADDSMKIRTRNMTNTILLWIRKTN